VLHDAFSFFFLSLPPRGSSLVERQFILATFSRKRGTETSLIKGRSLARLSLRDFIDVSLPASLIERAINELFE